MGTVATSNIRKYNRGTVEGSSANLARDWTKNIAFPKKVIYFPVSTHRFYSQSFIKQRLINQDVI